MKNKEIQEEESFGVIPLKKKEGEWLVFLIQHKEGGHWGFPKGRKEPEETPQQAAFRELKEETGLCIRRLLLEEPFIETYQFYRQYKLTRKQATYFLVEVEGAVQLQKTEISAGEWLSFSEALPIFTFPESKQILIQVKKQIEGDDFLAS